MVVRDFSRSGKDISESGDGRDISGKAGDTGCDTEIISGVEVASDNGTGEDISTDAIDTVGQIAVTETDDLLADR